MADRDEFYVGYLPTPPGLKRFYVLVAAALLALSASAAAASALLQRSPGASDRKKGVEITGVLDASAYGVLRFEDGGVTRHALLVSPGKFGLKEKFRALDGAPVTAKGLLLERDGRRLMELKGLAEAEDLDPAPPARRGGAAAVDLGEVTLRGEIVDSKCYMGRMRPGDGRAHRACAQLCVRGGIPPVLVTRAPGGAASHYLLVGPDGGAVNDAVLPYVAEPVALTGRLSRTGDLLTLSIDPAAIERL